MTHDVDALLAEAVPEDEPGCVLGVVADGALRAVAARGLANLEHGVPLTRDTVFHVASVSKQFAAYSCALLADRGDLDLDAQVSGILDFVPFTSITIRQLIHHVSGLRDQWELLLLCGRRLEDMITTAEIVERVARQRDLNFLPGEAYLYSNTGYTLLGLVVERVSGLSLREFAAAEIFGPLGMTTTRFLDDHHDVITGRADSYYPRKSDGNGRIALSYCTAGATSLNTTVPDLARWTIHAMTPTARRLLKQRIALNDGTPLGYGTGVMLGVRRGRPFIEHGGSDAGYRAQMLIYPEDGVGAIALSNRAGCPVADLAYRAADLALDALGVSRAEAIPRKRCAHVPESASGLYVEPLCDTTHILRLDGGNLVFDTSVFLPASEGVFVAEGRATSELHLGEELRLRSPSVPDRVFAPAEAWVPTPDELDRLPGRFWSDELEVYWTVARDDDGLVVRQPRWERLPLTPTVRHSFSFTVPSEPMGFRVDVRFDEQADGLFVSSGRVLRLRFRRVSDQ
jgi:CubicO group peptidase (beta-lactamase class C family)